MLKQENSIRFKYPANIGGLVPALPVQLNTNQDGVAIICNSSLLFFNNKFEHIRTIELDERRPKEIVVLRHNALTRNNIIKVVTNCCFDAVFLSKDNYITIIKDSDVNIFKFPIIPTKQQYSIDSIVIDKNNNFILYDSLGKQLLLLDYNFVYLRSIDVSSIEGTFVKLHVSASNDIHYLTEKSFTVYTNKNIQRIKSVDGFVMEDLDTDEYFNVFVLYRSMDYSTSFIKIYSVVKTQDKIIELDSKKKYNLVVSDNKILISSKDSVAVFVFTIDLN